MISNYALRTRIYRVTQNFVFLENLELEAGALFHISARLSRLDTDDGEEYYQRPEDPSAMAYAYHRNYGFLCSEHPWNPVTKKHEWNGKPPQKK